MSRSVFICLILMLGAFSINTIFAYPDSLLADNHKKQAIEFLSTDNLMVSNNHKKKAVKLFQQNDDLKNWIHLYRKLGREFRVKKEYNSALQLFQTAIEGGWRSPETPEEYTQQAWGYADIGYTYKQLNNLKAIATHYELALNIFQKDLKLENWLVANFVYSELGNAYSRLRDYQKAEFYLTKRIDIYKNEKTWKDIPGGYNDLGMVYLNMEKHSRAIDVFSRGLDQKKISFEYQTLLLINMAGAYLEEGDIQKALFHNRQCEDIIQQKNLSVEDQAEELLLVNKNYGKIYRASGDYKKAEYHFTKAIQSAQLYNRYEYRTIFLLYLERADLYNSWHQSDNAISDYTTAFQLILPDYANNNLTLPTEQQLTNEPNLMEAFGGLAKSFIMKYRQKKNPSFAEKATQCFQLAEKVKQKLVQLYLLEGSKLSALSEHRWVKEEQLSFLYELWMEHPSKEIAEQLFASSEQSRAFLLLQDIQVNKLFENEKLDSLKLLYFQSNKIILGLEESLSLFEKERNDSLQMKLIQEREQQKSIVKQLDRQVPEINLRDQNLSTLPEIQKSLISKQVVLEYFLGENYLFVLRITNDDFSSIRVNLPSNLFETINELRSTLINPSNATKANSFSSFSKSAYLLYEWLLKKSIELLPMEKKQLIIIPDGMLAFIPFDLLPNNSNQQYEGYADFPYLIKDFIVSYAPSASIQLHLKRKQSGRASKCFAGFAPTYDAKSILSQDTINQSDYAAVVRSDNFPLPGARAEVEAIQNILGGEKFIGQQANEFQFKRTARDYQILLLSMHSLVDIQHPGITKLLFTKGGSKDSEDDVLFSQELRNTQLQADLVVLSACNTGYGKLQKGEGAMSLSRSFFAIGVPSMVASLWKVPDVPTKEITVDFFTNLKAGLPKDQSLRLAKLNYLNNINSPSEANPYLWGGFVAAGDMTPLDLNRLSISFISYNTFGILILLMTVILSWLYLFKKKNTLDRIHSK